MSQSNPTQDKSFSGLGLSPQLLQQLDKLKFISPTPIQHQAIPMAAAGKDIIGIAQTGTGKTLAFLLPTIQQISQTKKQALIVLPTRELASQVEEALQQIGRSLGIRHATLIGGSPMGQQIRQLKQTPHVFIGTPGRIIDHLEQRTLNIENVGILVLDEADRMLDMGFMPQINEILKKLPRQRQTMLFSATMPPAIVKIASQHMAMPTRVEIARAGTIADKVKQELFIVPKDKKNQLLDKLLSDYQGTVLVFSRTKHGARRICRAVKDMGHAAAEIHSNLNLSQRRRSLDGFKSGKFRVLVATDIAARGIDVTNIELVINFDLPDNLDDYIHRVGRTGRAGKQGEAISFVTPDQKGKVRMIERLARTRLTLSAIPELPPSRPQPKDDYQEDRHSRHQSRRPRRSHSGQRRQSGPRKSHSRSHAPSGNRSGRRRPRLHT